MLGHMMGVQNKIDKMQVAWRLALINGLLIHNVGLLHYAKANERPVTLLLIKVNIVD